MDILIILLRVALVLLCLFMGLVILMQRSKQEGLGAAFGSSMTDTVFGAETTNVLVKTTVWCSVLFFVIVLTLSSLLAHQHKPAGALSSLLPPAGTVSNVVESATNAVAPASAPAPAPDTNAPAPAAAPAN